MKTITIVFMNAGSVKNQMKVRALTIRVKSIDDDPWRHTNDIR